MNDSTEKFERHFQKQARYLRKTTNGWRGSSCVYQLNVPFNGIYQHVVVSVIKLDNGDYEGIVCGCDYNGELYNPVVLSMSCGPNISHIEVLTAIGYKVNESQR
jgi:hypothetical protein